MNKVPVWAVLVGALTLTGNAQSQEEPIQNEGSAKLPVDASVETYPNTIAVTEPKTADADKPTSPRTRNRLIEEIVVTARKREESIQDVPLSISAFSADKLDAVGIESAEQLDKVTPGLVFSSSLGFNVVFLRGIGTDAYLPAADPSVPIYIDDIAVLPTQGSVNTLGNIERVEVLKGPQGTLFGRNSLGGAIRIVTKTPDDSGFFGDAKVDFGNYGRQNVSAFVNVPIAEGLAASVSGYSQEEDPYYQHTSDPGKIFNVYSRGGRASVYWKASDNVDLRLTGSAQKSSTIAGLVLEGTRPAAIVCAVCAADEGPDFRSPINVPGGSITKNYLISGQLGWKLPWADSKLILSDQHLEIPYASTDLDGTSTPLVTAYTDSEYGDQRTAEFRLESNQNTPFSDQLTWVAGAFYLKSAGGYHPVQFSIAENLITAIPGADSFNDQVFDLLESAGINLGTGATLFSTGIIKTESISGYGQANYTFLDDYVLTAGLRYDTEKRSLNDSKLEAQNPVGGNKILILPFSVPELNTDRWSPRVSLQWNFAEASQIYTSYAIGYLSPTYNSVNFFTVPDLVKQERDDAYELGVKTSLFSGALTFDGSIFYTKRQDIISAYTTIASGVAVRFYNAGSGIVKGAEFNIQAQPLPDINPGLAILVAGTFLDTKYTDLPNGRGYDEATGLGFGPGSLTGPARDFTGNSIVNSPTFSGTATIAQTVSVGSNSSIELAFDTYYSSGFYFTPQNSKAAEQTDYALYNARTTYNYDPLNIQVSAYVENLTNRKHLSSVFQFDTSSAYQLANPRMYGLRLKWSF